MVADVLALDDPAASHADVTGGKAAALATAARAGLPVLPGFVLATGFAARIDAGADLFEACEQARSAWSELTADGERALVVRSSSPAEDTATRSMAGRYASMLDVRGWADFVASVGAVLRSRAAATGVVGEVEPIAVLVQPLLSAVAGGVLFGVDPVTGRSDRRVVAAVRGLPDRLVSGEVDGTRYVLTPEGRPAREPVGERVLSAADLRALAGLADSVAARFGGPQDVEWARDGDGVLWLLQSRPVTAEVRGVPTGPVLGPGPVAETFPEPLATLEVDLWVPPLRAALREALALTGTRSAAELGRSPVVAVIDGQVALDLELLARVPPSWRARLDPRPPWRRARAAWRVGRLRAALPAIAADVVAAADAELARVPELGELTDRQLLALLCRAGGVLRSLHAHEVLVGQAVRPDAARVTGAGIAVRLLAHARAEGLSDAEAAHRYPTVLALAPPRVQPHAPLPATSAPPPSERPSEPPSGPRSASPPRDRGRAALLREALRLRVRWTQELTGRAAWALGERLAAADRLAEPADIRTLRLDDVAALVRGDAVVGGLPTPHPAPQPSPAPLPARFRLSDRGRPIPAEGAEGADGPDGSDGHAAGAGGGCGSGPVHMRGAEPAPPGSVLVTTTLHPSLAAELPRLAGLVAETGSVLAHLAILAREAGVPTVVGAVGAAGRFRPGERVTVDGDTGEVHREEEA